MFHLLLSDDSVYLMDKAELVMPWVTVGVAVAVLLGLLAFFIFKKEYVKKYLKISCIAFVLYSLLAGIIMLCLEVAKKYSLSYLQDNYVDNKIITQVFIPIIALLVVLLLSFVILIIVYNKRKDLFKRFSVILGCIAGAVTVFLLVMISIYFKEIIATGGYYTSDDAKFNSIALWVSAALLVVATIVIAFFTDKSTTKMDARCMAIAGVTTALSFALSYVKFPGLEAIFLQGGSVTLFSMLPIMIFSYVYGMKRGLIVGFVYGILQALQDPFIVHGAQFLLDYPIAFSMTAYAGILKNVRGLDKVQPLKFALSATVGGSLRYFAHVLSGVSQ